ncbi:MULTISPECIES: dTDP-4-dehydrorhamnose 3,5-epimerase [Paenibacillus]|uniref:dTDP-4-dehydrorhamnose 3,5-epimerase n=1 Tax=Paenibacillus TaxID=44249 RepID=UPI002DB73B88|nr:dTDP-4-dehydrorhamnose 3,5-epimerase [Paenibacillus odorifer]MEC0133031.1 dTDP-4-dehydrorhamnose 3,5-epimerase [Paenibacillus odorifer]MEC0223466.1 dTDP-4-dehydrorhamnose 3,5-epimerase [Paenibacillus odorifer]
MKFLETPLKGAYLIEIEPHQDERGFFARTFCKEEFIKHDLKDDFLQCNVSFNHRRGTVRGMHYQVKPFEETKLIRCTRGAIYDVIIDLCQTSDTYLRWYAIELNENNGRMLYVPEGFAHGFQTLEDNTEVFYQMSEFYHPDCATGVRWDDPTFGIRWPLTNYIMNDKDRNYPNWNL